MVEVPYGQELEYLRDSETGNPFPGLWIVLNHLSNNRELEVQVHLDSGTESSII
jgi:hypothetical protein